MKTFRSKNRMLKLTGILFIVFLAGCAWFDKLTHFNIRQTKSFIIPAHVPANFPYDIYTPYFATNSEKYFGENNTQADMVESIKMISLIGTIPETINEDWSFVSWARIYLVTKAGAVAEVAYKYDIPDTIGRNLSFDIKDVELTNFMVEDSLSFRIQIYTNRSNTIDIPAKVEAEMFVDAKILGV